MFNFAFLNIYVECKQKSKKYKNSAMKLNNLYVE